MGNNGGKYNINKKNLYMGGKTNQKKNNGRNESHHKKKRKNKICKYNTQLVSITDLIFGDRIICTVGYLCKQQKPCMVRK